MISSSLEAIRALFERMLPVEGRGFQLILPPGSSERFRQEGARVFVSIVVALMRDGSVEDCREQAIVIADLSKAPVERWLAMLEAQLRALPALGEWMDLGSMLPCDVFAFYTLVEDETLDSVSDFSAFFANRDRVRALLDRALDDEWQETADELGLGAHAAELRALERTCARLHFEPIESPEDEDEPPALALGAARFGGQPDLEPSAPWPVAPDGEPMIFVAQIKLEDLAAERCSEELPAQGLLSFFYAPFSAGDSLVHPVAVLHTTSGALERRATPERVDVLVEHAITVSRERMFPSESTPFYEALVDEEEVLAFQRALSQPSQPGDVALLDPLPHIGMWAYDRSEASFERPIHRMLGYASHIQGDPYLDVEVAAREGGWDNFRAGTREAIAIHRNARRWRLLLQIDASGDGELLLNQDGGYFYFWLTDEALARNAWSEAIGTLQCH